MSGTSERGDWFSDLGSAIRSRDASEVAQSLYYGYAGLWHTATSRFPTGTNVFERDWDALVVLDACRVDALREVAPEYDFIENVESVWSVGGTSHEWYAKTFVPKYANTIAETALISSNPYAEVVLLNGEHPPFHPMPFSSTKYDPVSADALAYSEPTRQHDRPYDDVSDTAPKSKEIEVPSYVTDRGIVAGREGYERLMLHYFQPHRPYIHNFVTRGEPMTYIEDAATQAARQGRADFEDLWPLYLDNLRLALDSIEVLLENLDAEKVVITSDHGELLGELGQWGHFQGVFHPALMKVPWVETTARDTGSRQPEEEFTTSDESDVKDQLRDLGYI